MKITIENYKQVPWDTLPMLMRDALGDDKINIVNITRNRGCEDETYDIEYRDKNHTVLPVRLVLLNSD